MREDDLIQSEKKYIEVQYDSVTQGYLREYCEQNGFDLSVRFDGSKQDPENFDFHTTVWFTSSKHKLANQSISFNATAQAKGFALLGPDKNILVLEIESDDIQEIRDFYGKLHDMQDEWPDYRPHITVCYRWEGDIPDVDLPDMDLKTDRLNIKTQKKFE